MFKLKLISFLLRCFAQLPLPIIHHLGAAIGWGVSVFAHKFPNRIMQNLRMSFPLKSDAELNQLVNSNMKESGKAVLETFAIWFRNMQALQPWFKDCSGWQHVDAGFKAGRGIIFLTPHLGSFEITSLYYGQFHPITVLYRPPRQAWLMPLIATGRQRGGVTLAPANAQGVKQLLQALKRNEAVGILPDQAPLEGEGEWAPFFGRPAYTMSLASKLAKKTGALVLMAYGERLSGGRGYHVHIRPVTDGGIHTPALLNAEIEQTILQCPAQYIWAYDRYKVRAESSEKFPSNQR